MPGSLGRSIVRFDEKFSKFSKLLGNGRILEFASELSAQTTMKNFADWSLTAEEVDEKIRIAFEARLRSVPIHKKNIWLDLSREKFTVKNLFHGLQLKLNEVKFPLRISYDVAHRFVISDGTEGNYIVHLNDDKVEYVHNRSLIEAKEQAMNMKEFSTTNKPTKLFGL